MTTALVSAVVGLLVGLWIRQHWDQRGAQFLLLGAIVLAVGSQVAYLTLSDLSPPLVDWRVRQLIGQGSWIGLFLAAGAFGPAVLSRREPAILLSVLAIGVASTLGVWLMFSLACSYAGECM